MTTPTHWRKPIRPTLWDTHPHREFIDRTYALIIAGPDRWRRAYALGVERLCGSGAWEQAVERCNPYDPLYSQMRGQIEDMLATRRSQTYNKALAGALVCLMVFSEVADYCEMEPSALWTIANCGGSPDAVLAYPIVLANLELRAYCDDTSRGLWTREE